MKTGPMSEGVPQHNDKDADSLESRPSSPMLSPSKCQQSLSQQHIGDQSGTTSQRNYPPLQEQPRVDQLALNGKAPQSAPVMPPSNKPAPMMSTIMELLSRVAGPPPQPAPQSPQQEVPVVMSVEDSEAMRKLEKSLKEKRLADKMAALGLIKSKKPKVEEPPITLPSDTGYRSPQSTTTPLPENQPPLEKS